MRRRWIGLLLGLQLASGLARADDAGTSWRDHVTLVVSDRLRGEFAEWFRPRPAPGVPVPADANRWAFMANQLRIGARVLFPSLEVGVDVQDTRLAGVPDDATFAPPIGPLGPGGSYFAATHDTEQGETFLKQGFLTLRRAGVALTGGRFEVREGLETVPSDPTLAALKRMRIAERLVGPFDFTHVTRSFDGVRVAWDRPELNVTALAVHPTYGGFEVSANRELDRISLAGLALTAKRIPGAPPVDARLFYLFYEDARRGDVVKVDARPLPVRTADHDAIAIHTIGAHALGAIDAGPGVVDLLAWAAAQTGQWGVQDHAAWAYALEAGYQLPRVPGAPWLRVGWDRSSGDDRPDDREHRTFFQLLPTARTYAQLPFYNLMNSDDLFASLIVKPHARVTVRSDWHHVRLGESRDLWYGGGGAGSESAFGFTGIPSSGRRDLADVVDASVAVTLVKQLAVQAYYGRAFGGGVVHGTFEGRNAHYGFVELVAKY